MKKLKKAAAILICLVLILSTLGTFASASGDKTLQFNKDGKFTILNISDIQDNYPLVSITRDYIRDTLEAVDPDLVILNGDNIAGYNCNTKVLSKLAIDEYMSIFEAAGVKVAMVFGNHDDEKNLASKEYQISCYEQYSCFIGCAGEDMTGCGNYNLPILSSDGSHYAFNLWFTDSGTYNDENDLGGYGCPHKDQIDWYKRTSKQLAEQNGGKPVPAMNFQHIIVPEIYQALAVEGDKFVLPKGAKGQLNEMPCPPAYSNGQFDAFLEMGDVIATFSGHDHVNTFEVDYKGIKIINTPGIGFSTYNGDVVGSRVIILNEKNARNFETYCLSYFNIYSPEDPFAVNRYRMYSDTTDGFEKIDAFFGIIPEYIGRAAVDFIDRISKLISIA